MSAETITAESLAKLQFRGPVVFRDGRNGMAGQDFQCTTIEPFGFTWERKDRKHRGRQFFTVDGVARTSNSVNGKWPDPRDKAEHDDLVALAKKLEAMARKA